MRPLELEILCLLSATLVATVPSHRPRPRWWPYVPITLFLLVIVHLAAEGYRWQMFPAYLLTALLLGSGIRALILNRCPPPASGPTPYAIGFDAARILLCVIAVILPIAASHTGPHTKAETLPQKTKIVLLGTGSPQTDPDHSGPAVAIIVNDSPYLVDFGPGVVRRAAAARKRGLIALRDENLRCAFVTHLHSDHTAGYPDLILTSWVAGRKEPLEVYGPAGLAEMTTHILRAYHKDIEIRSLGSEGENPNGAQVHVHEIRPGIIYKDANVTVRAFLVKHGSWDQAFGYRFETPDRTVVISGDTTKTDAIAENCAGCDVLIHEVYSAKKLRERPLKWQKYHSSYHTSAPELAELATRAKPGLLILYHELLDWASEEDIVSEVKAGYAGRVVFGRDLDVY
jgi:ribonuclease BN (tRNA processing enzyme)